MRKSVMANSTLWLSFVHCIVVSALTTSSSPQNDKFPSPVTSTDAFSQKVNRALPKFEFIPQSPSKKSNSSRRTKRRQQAPLVDSTLLRFLSTQKRQDTSATVALYTPSNVLPVQKEQDDVIQPKTQLVSWEAQFNRNRVARTLLQLDATANTGGGDGTSSISQEGALAAGDAVQSHLLARIIRRRLRVFLKLRDSLWSKNATATASVSSSSSSTSAIIRMDEADNTKRMSLEEDLHANLHVLLENGLSVNDICSILTHTPSVALMKAKGEGNTLEATCSRALTQVLCGELKLRRYDARKVLRNCPGLLTVRGSSNAQNVVALLSKLGVSKTSLARDKNGLPVLLSRSPAAIFRLVAFLSSDAVRMPVSKIGPLLRRPECATLLNAVAPVPRLQNSKDNNDDSSKETQTMIPLLWVKESQEQRGRINALYNKMSETAWTLRHDVGTADLGKVIAAYPTVLLLNAETQILPTASYLMNDLGIWQDDLPQVLQLYPTLLGMDVTDMKRVTEYLLSLGVTQESLTSIFRAFPSLLTLDVEKDMHPVVEFLRDIGIINIGRFVTRLPPIFGYSVENELKPKWEYLNAVCTQGSFELSTFPAYFSYPLDRVVKTRYEYLRMRGIPSQFLQLDVVLRYGDVDFAIRVARDDDGGASFRRFVDGRKKKDVTVRRKRPTGKKRGARGAHRKGIDNTL